jgi:myo-inositol 2-dehydrogenase / D-chiro-inositol 1-dehydrogenase
VLGCGTLACWAHLPILARLPGARLVAAADPDPAARARAQRITKGAVHERADDAIARDDVDAVIIASATPSHAALAVAAARAGKHVYIEKPLALEAGEARRVLDAVRRAQVVGAVGFNFRAHPLHRRAAALVRAGRLGTLRAVQSAFCEPVAADRMPSWKRRRETGGGVLLDLASHHVDSLRWMLADEVISVDEARIGSLETDQDVARLTLRLRSGCDVQAYCSFRAGPADYLELIGDRGTLRVDRYRSRLELRVARRFGYGMRTSWARPDAALASLAMRRLARPSYEPSFRLSLAAFVDRLRGGLGPLATIEDGACSLAVVLAAEESARTGRRVPVESID